MHLRQPGLRIKKFKETGYSQYIYQKELDKVSCQHDIASGDFKSLARRTASDKIFCDKAFDIAKNPKNDGYQRGLASMVSKLFDKKSSGSSVAMLQNQQLSVKLHKPIIKKFKKRKVYSSFKDNIWVMI